MLVLPVAVAAVSVWAAVSRLILLEPAEQRGRVQAQLVAALLIPTLVICGASYRWSPHLMVEALVTVVAALGLGRGVYLLFRQLAGRQILITVSVALLPVMVPVFAGWGAAVHVFYGAEFGIPPEDMNIAQVWRFLASAWVFATALVLALAFCGVIGYVVHYRLVVTERVTTAVLLLTIFLSYVLAALLLIFDPPSEAGERAKADIAAGRVPGQYLGIHAEPVCLIPVEPIRKIPVAGGRLDPAHVYLSFGIVDGTAALWDPASGQDLRVPAGKVTVLPAELNSGRIPEDCRSTVHN
ncbi:hypothetical protein FHS35_004824 [Streptomyces umbrinus]|uniref:hypothetical protein n=2 Tax=Streptomyces phaeochromogenes group TaxID=2838332 RepID=UPI00167E8FBD|nr:hypothetical protein [Streptomyces umbrinus]MCR3727950.1 hypothetical protein [Streptomyces umbrinus]